MWTHLWQFEHSTHSIFILKHKKYKKHKKAQNAKQAILFLLDIFYAHKNAAFFCFTHI